MKWKLILTCATFFLATPILIGQTLPDIPSLPATPNIPGAASLPSSLPSTTLPSTSIPSNLPHLPSTISADTLQQAGLDTSVLDQDPRTRASALRDHYKQGLLDDHRLPTLPATTDQAGALAKRFAEQTFPQEFQASKGLLALPESAPSAFPTSIPSSIPTNLPTGLPSTLPPTPSIPQP